VSSNFWSLSSSGLSLGARPLLRAFIYF
jgi:hypothetical protein